MSSYFLRNRPKLSRNDVIQLNLDDKFGNPFRSIALKNKKIVYGTSKTYVLFDNLVSIWPLTIKVMTGFLGK